MQAWDQFLFTLKNLTIFIWISKWNRFVRITHVKCYFVMSRNFSLKAYPPVKRGSISECVKFLEIEILCLFWTKNKKGERWRTRMNSLYVVHLSYAVLMLEFNWSTARFFLTLMSFIPQKSTDLILQFLPISSISKHITASR